MIFCKNPSGAPFLFYRRQTVNLPPIQRRAAGGDFTLEVSVHSGRLRRRRRRAHGGGNCRCSPAGTKGDRTPNMVSCPLLTPLTFLCADTSKMCSETGVQRLGSVRRAAYGTLLCPEFTLRYPPRITVRGHSLQGVHPVAAKNSDSIKRCPLEHQTSLWALAFRRATEGSRVLRRVWGSQEGAREPYGALAPFCLRRQTAAIPLPVGTGTPSAVGYGLC